MGFVSASNLIISFAILAVVAGLGSAAAFYASSDISKYAATLPAVASASATAARVVIADQTLARAKMYADTAAVLAGATALGALVALVFYSSQQKPASALVI